jgi:hypothetical protein
MPTMLDYLALPRQGPMQGISLRPLIEGRSGEPRDTIWAELRTWTQVQAVIGDRAKLIRNVAGGTWELYDLPRDPREQTNLFDQSRAADTRVGLVARLEQWTRDNTILSEQFAADANAPNVPVSEQRLLELKTLGYVQ